MRLRRLRAGAATAVAVVALAGCSGSDEPAVESEADPGTSQPPILQPGAPGEPNTTVDPNDPEAVPADEHNDEDVAFVTMMIPHHTQALRMTDLVEGRAADGQVVAISSRIHDAQRVEIAGMEEWLRGRDLDVPDPDAEDHHSDGMPGMLSEDEFAALEAARGAQFDRLFIEKMIAHHEGALEMADRVLNDGVDIQARALAADVATSQSVEIDILEGLLAAER